MLYGTHKQSTSQEGRRKHLCSGYSPLYRKGFDNSQTFSGFRMTSIRLLTLHEPELGEVALPRNYFDYLSTRPNEQSS